MNRLELLLKLVELAEDGDSEEVEKLLAGRTHDELSMIASRFSVLASYAEEAPRSKELDTDDIDE